MENKKGKVDKSEEEKKITNYRVQLGDKERIPPVSPTFGKFPYVFWAEWDKDCVNNFHGTRWMKAWQDHMIAKQSRKEEVLWNLVLELKQKMEGLEQMFDEVKEEEEKEDVVAEDFVPTLGNPTPKKIKGEKK